MFDHLNKNLFFKAWKYDKRTIKFYENQTKMSILSKPSDLKNFPFALKVDLKKNFSENLKNSNSFKQLSNVEILKQYKSSARCAVFLSLFMAFPMLSNPMFLKESNPFNNSSIADASNNTFVYAITYAIKHPTVVVQVTLDYIVMLSTVLCSLAFIGDTIRKIGLIFVRNRMLRNFVNKSGK